MTDSGCKVLKEPSRWAVPAPTVGYSPRTRATSKLITCIDALLPCYCSPAVGQTSRVTDSSENHTDHSSRPDDAVAAEVVDATEADRDDSDITGMVEQPAKVMRIGTMIKQLLEEVRAAPLDEAGRHRLREIHESSIRELEQGLAPELRDEL
ncbi:MAG: proteasome activator, partial [Pseudonocardiales bacterium]